MKLPSHCHYFLEAQDIPSRQLAAIPCTFEDDFPFAKVRYVSFLEGCTCISCVNSIYLFRPKIVHDFQPPGVQNAKKRLS